MGMWCWYGKWRTAYGLRLTGVGLRPTADGLRETENGGRPTLGVDKEHSQYSHKSIHKKKGGLT